MQSILSKIAHMNYFSEFLPALISRNYISYLSNSRLTPKDYWAISLYYFLLLSFWDFIYFNLDYFDVALAKIPYKPQKAYYLLFTDWYIVEEKQAKVELILEKHLNFKTNKIYLDFSLEEDFDINNSSSKKDWKDLINSLKKA